MVDEKNDAKQKSSDNRKKLKKVAAFGASALAGLTSAQPVGAVMNKQAVKDKFNQACKETKKAAIYVKDKVIEHPFISAIVATPVAGTTVGLFYKSHKNNSEKAKFDNFKHPMIVTSESMSTKDRDEAFNLKKLAEKHRISYIFVNKENAGGLGIEVVDFMRDSKDGVRRTNYSEYSKDDDRVIYKEVKRLFEETPRFPILSTCRREINDLLRDESKRKEFLKEVADKLQKENDEKKNKEEGEKRKQEEREARLRKEEEDRKNKEEEERKKKEEDDKKKKEEEERKKREEEEEKKNEEQQKLNNADMTKRLNELKLDGSISNAQLKIEYDKDDPELEAVLSKKGFFDNQPIVYDSVGKRFLITVKQDIGKDEFLTRYGRKINVTFHFASSGGHTAKDKEKEAFKGNLFEFLTKAKALADNTRLLKDVKTSSGDSDDARKSIIKNFIDANKSVSVSQSGDVRGKIDTIECKIDGKTDNLLVDIKTAIRAEHWYGNAYYKLADDDYKNIFIKFYDPSNPGNIKQYSLHGITKYDFIKAIVDGKEVKLSN